jgi:hypothetical protein
VNGVVEEVAEMHPHYGLQLRPKHRHDYVTSVLPRLRHAFSTAAAAPALPTQPPAGQEPADNGLSTAPHCDITAPDTAVTSRERSKKEKKEKHRHKEKHKGKHKQGDKHSATARSGRSPAPAVPADATTLEHPQAGQVAAAAAAAAAPPKFAQASPDAGPPKWIEEADDDDDDDFEPGVPAWAEQEEDAQAGCSAAARSPAAAGVGAAGPWANPWQLDTEVDGAFMVHAAPGCGGGGSEAATPHRTAATTALPAVSLRSEGRQMSTAEKRERTQATAAEQPVLKHQQKQQQLSVPVATVTKREVAVPLDEGWFAEFVDPVSGAAAEPMAPAEFDRQYGVYKRLREVVSGMVGHFQQWQDEAGVSDSCARAVALETLQAEYEEQGAQLQRCVRALDNLHDRLSHVKQSMGP